MTQIAKKMVLGLMLLLAAATGACASVSNPVGRDVPADSVPAELKAALVLMESSGRLNETALELIKSHLGHASAAQTAPAAPAVQAPAVQTPAVTLPAQEVQQVVVTDTVTVYALPDRPGGEYVWIPDSVQMDFARFMARRDSRDIVLHEDTVARGIVLPDIDKDPEVLRDRNLGRFHRGLFNYRFLPKGEWVFGLTASYGEFSTDDLEMFEVLKDVTLGGHSFSIRPQMQYLLRDNMAVGLRFNYSRTKGTIDNFGLDIDEDMSFSLNDITYKSESYAAAITYTQYLGLARRGRFGIFNEVELSFSSGNGDFVRPFGGKLKTTHTTTTGVGLNFSPGVSVFMMKQASFNISFGVFGFYLKNEKQWVDGVESGNRLRSGANFRFNIFNINFGLAIHI
ncbi:MAG: hypothetical protein K2O24_06305 [Muribaculaceae bacterium]|nr:hypothetical protein [Muribaculaceae bacterium]